MRLSREPQDIAKDATVLVVQIPQEVVCEYEYVEEGQPCRAFLVPASVANRCPVHSVIGEETTDRLAAFFTGEDSGE